MTSFASFLDTRRQLATLGGFEPTFLPDDLFDFQRVLVEWAIRHGRVGLFADCGMGKTLMELVWAQNVHLHTGKPVLYITPLAVGFQAEQEAHKFHIDAAISRGMSHGSLRQGRKLSWRNCSRKPANSHGR